MVIISNSYILDRQWEEHSMAVALPAAQAGLYSFSGLCCYIDVLSRMKYMLCSVLRPEGWWRLLPQAGREGGPMQAPNQRRSWLSHQQAGREAGDTAETVPVEVAPLEFKTGRPHHSHRAQVLPSSLLLCLHFFVFTCFSFPLLCFVFFLRISYLSLFYRRGCLQT